ARHDGPHRRRGNRRRRRGEPDPAHPAVPPPRAGPPVGGPGRTARRRRRVPLRRGSQGTGRRGRSHRRPVAGPQRLLPDAGQQQRDDAALPRPRHQLRGRIRPARTQRGGSRIPLPLGRHRRGRRRRRRRADHERDRAAGDPAGLPRAASRSRGPDRGPATGRGAAPARRRPSRLRPRGRNRHRRESPDVCDRRGLSDMARHGAELLPQELPADLRRDFESYLTSLRFERGLSRNSIDAYARDLARYGTWLAGVGISRLGEVDRGRIEAYGLHLIDTGLAPRTRARALVAVRRFHTFALAENLAPTDPASEVSPPQEGLRLPKALTLDDIEAMLATTNGEEPVQIRAAALLELLYATGARISEAVGVDLDDLDLGSGLVRLYGKG